MSECTRECSCARQKERKKELEECQEKIPIIDNKKDSSSKAQCCRLTHSFPLGLVAGCRCCGCCSCVMSVRVPAAVLT